MSPSETNDATIAALGRGGWAIVVAWLLVILAAGYFVYRGPARVWNDEGNSDFRSLYAGAVAWVEGGNPYDNANLSRILASRGFEGGDLSDRQALQVAPPLVFALLSPLWLLDWPATNLVWMGLNCLMTIVVADRVRALAGFSWRQWQGPALLAGTLALAPFHTAIFVGQFAIISTAFVALAIDLSSRGRPIAAGICYAIASAFKPTIAGLFLFHFAINRRWRVIAVAAIVGALIVAVAFGRLMMTDVKWWATWREMWRTFVDGGQADPTAVNDWRFQLVNLHVLLHVFIDSRGTVKLLVWLFFGATIAVMIAALLAKRKRGIATDGLLFCAIAAAVSLLIVYHRFYDAVLLVFPLAWAIGNLGRRRLIAIGVLLLSALFLAPGASMLDSFASRGRIPGHIADAVWFEGIMLFHEIWALILLVGLLSFAWCRSPAPRSEPIFSGVGVECD